MYGRCCEKLNRKAFMQIDPEGEDHDFEDIEGIDHDLAVLVRGGEAAAAFLMLPMPRIESEAPEIRHLKM